MAIKPRLRLESIARDLEKVAWHIHAHRDIHPSNAVLIDNVASGIAETAAQIAEMAREMAGQKSARKLTVNVRRALGFTYP